MTAVLEGKLGNRENWGITGSETGSLLGLKREDKIPVVIFLPQDKKLTGGSRAGVVVVVMAGLHH